MAAVLSAYGSAIWLEHRAHLHVDIVVAAVAMTMTLARVQRGADLRTRLFGTAVVVVSAATADEVSSLLRSHPFLGATAFTAAMASTIWIRRFGPRAAKAGSAVMVPFIALLVTQNQDAPPHTATYDVWYALIALVAAFWVGVYQLGATALGRRGQRIHRAAPRSLTPTTSTSTRRLKPSTRMAAQMAVALASAFTVGHLAFHDHWPWAVLTAFVVCSGARSRGDVLHKGVLRAVGAAVGTVVATQVAGAFPAGDRWSVVIIFAVLGVASWLREISYALWAGSVTAVLSLLYGYFGQSAPSLLETRLEAIVAGAAVGIAASWFVLPIRTGDVLKRRMAEAVAARERLLAAPEADQAEIRRRQAHFQHAVRQLEQIAKPLRTYRILTGRAMRPDAIDTLRRATELASLQAPYSVGRATELAGLQAPYSVRSTSAADAREARTDGAQAPTAAITAPETPSTTTVCHPHTASSEAGRSRPVP